MGMMHYDAVLGNAIMIVSGEIGRTQSDEAYIVQNIYGKILVYIKTENDETVRRMEEVLGERIGRWLSCCEKFGENFFVVPEIESWKKERTGMGFGKIPH